MCLTGWHVSQIHRNADQCQEQAQQCGAHHGPGSAGVQGGLWRGSRDQSERPVFFGPLLHEPNLHTHADESAQ